jgi:hypothetical protein
MEEIEDVIPRKRLDLRAQQRVEHVTLNHEQDGNEADQIDKEVSLLLLQRAPRDPSSMFERNGSPFNDFLRLVAENLNGWFPESRYAENL